MVALLSDNITNKLEYFFRKKYWSLSMNVNPSDLLPTQPNHTYGSKLTPFGLFKNVLLCFVVLGGLYIIVDKVTDEHTMKIERKSMEKDECEDVEDHLGHKKFSENMLNVEREALSANALSSIKSDVASLKSQVMNLWNNMNGVPSTCEIPEIENKIRHAILESDVVDSKIKKALDTYDADKLALYDYAADYAGGEIIAIPETTPYPTSKIMQLFGFFKLTYSSSPNEIIKPSTIPGDCFRFYGSKAKIILRLGKKIPVGSVTMEHSPLLEDHSDAPKDFKVFGLTDSENGKKILLGTYTFNIQKHDSSIQNFPISSSIFSNNDFEYVELEILSNHGNERFTSIYRFRVHAGKTKE
ncbi:SUN domain-containing protein 3-like [Coccinella septempunctata]|uniref:SUN domain-containing protein 3-like n=1 Tax=Coccinella septempunctata TaxID=41139 RepID=UPI001D086984|nr:SUN domain-containing protein 3-like [Coccinella septempunctata]